MTSTTVPTPPDVPQGMTDTIHRFGHHVLSLATYWPNLGPDDRALVARALADAADDLAPALALLRRPGMPDLCTTVTVDVCSASVCGHEVHR